jgi:two-component system response regulator FixJ
MTERRKLVIIVDDDDAVRDSLEVVLQAAGYAIEAYASGPDLLAAIDDRVTACVLLDAKMPHMSGLTTLKHLQTVRPDLPVIMITGGGDSSTAKEAIKTGAVDYVAKPVLENILLERVDGALALLEKNENNSPYTEIDHVHRKLQGLTANERRSFEMLVGGKNDRFISSSLGIGTIDVIHLRDNIMEKMEARSLMQLKRMAFLSGIAIEDHEVC